MSKRPIDHSKTFVVPPPSKRLKRCSTPEILLQLQFGHRGAWNNAFNHYKPEEANGGLINGVPFFVA